jgi:hypothetical protein
VTFNKNIGLGVGIGIGVIGLVALIVKEKDRLEDFLPVFRNFFGGNMVLTSYPRGIRNNNPGNIEMTRTLWKGEIPQAQNTDGRFKQFYNYTYGIRAAILNLKSYHKDGYRTIRQMITRWAPPNENKTEAYIRFVSGYTGIAENTPVSFNRQTVKKLVEAITIKENGRLYMNDNDFDKAWRLV